jgi:hypothetical protein
MKKIMTCTVVLTLAVAFCFPLVSEGLAQLNDPLTQGQALNNLRNARKATPIPTWQITQPNSAFSVPWVDHAPNPRFAVYDPNGDSTGDPGTWFDDIVLDKETGLVWERRPGSTFPEVSWDDAVGVCYQRRLADRRGWRVPHVVEFLSLVDDNAGPPRLPTNHPFSLSPGTYGEYYYWSSTTTPSSPFGVDDPGALIMIFGSGVVYTVSRDSSVQIGVWCVRGGVGLFDHFAP